MLLDEAPDFLGDLLVVVADDPVVEHAAELVGRPVEEGLLLLGQRDGWDGAQLLPVGLTREQLCVEADGAGVESLLLRGGDLGQDALDLVIGGADQGRTAYGRHAEPGQNDHWHPGQEPEQIEHRLMPIAVNEAGAPGQHRRRQGRGPAPQGRLPHGKHEGAGDA